MTDLHTAAIAAHQTLAAFDAETERRNDTVRQHKGVAAQLRNRRTALKAQEPRMPAQTNRSAVAALLADLSAPIAIDDTTVEAEGQAASAHRAALSRWNAEMRVIDAAIVEVDLQLDVATAQLSGREQDRDPLWVEFVRCAHAYLLEKLERALEPIRTEIMVPLDALDVQKRPGSNGVRIVGGAERRLNPASLMQIYTEADRRGETLLAGRDHRRYLPDTDAAADIATFRQGLEG